MIKRQYFIEMQVVVGGGTQHRFRLFTRTSWLPQHSEALTDEIDNWSKEMSVGVGSILVNTFNRV